MEQIEIPLEIEQIVADLERRLQNEQAINATLHAEGRIHYSHNGEEKVGWLHRLIPQNAAVIRNIVGDPVTTAPGQASYYNPGYSAISRNSPTGNRLAEAVPGQEVNGLKLLSRALYTHLPSPADLQDIDISTLTGDFPRIASLARYQQALLNELRKKQHLLALQQEARQAQDDEAIAGIKAQLDETDQRIKRIRERLDVFIAKTRLRIRPQLDGVQNKAKRLNLLAGPVIIEGGPGTGKTTTLIHRIQYLLDTYHLRQDEEFADGWQKLGLAWTAEDDALLRDEPGRIRFRFYSPNRTLKYYLQEALKTERLDSANVTTWTEHRQRLLRDLNLTGTHGRFQAPRAAAPLLQLSGSQVRELLTDLEEYLVFDVQTLADRLEKSFAVGAFGWQREAAVQGLVRQIKELAAIDSVAELLRPLQQLRERGAGLLKEYRDNHAQARDEAVTLLLASVRQDTALYRQLVQLAETDRDEADDPDAPQDAETYEDEEASPAGMDDDARHLLLVRRMLRAFVRAYALSRTLPDTVLKGRNAQLAALLSTQLTRVRHEAVATGTRFMQLFNRLLSGPEVMLLQALPRVFNAFRRETLYGKRYATAFLETQPKWSTEKTATLHADEADVLLLLLFQLARQFYQQLPRVFTESTNPYLARYRDEMRPVVGVDEASDFTPLQLAAITLLSHPRYSCVTLCGDLMQRLGQQGLLSWADYTVLFPATDKASLTVSYRQCQALLRLAAKLYEGQMQERPAYRVSRRIKMPFKLRPTYCRDADATARFEWLVNLLVGLVRTLDGKHIPNLAILVKDSAAAHALAAELSEDDRMLDANLPAQACQDQRIGDADAIRIFPVSEIKGMEFDGIIFWDADELERENRQLDLDRLMYVAVSRASFYVAVTFARHFPKALANVKSSFVTETWGEQMLAAVADDEEDEEA